MNKDDLPENEEAWRERLNAEQYHVLREKGTEGAFSGKYYQDKRTGMYVCAACGNELFSSETKYESGSGWPSFYAPVTEESVETNPDESLGMHRTEVVCRQCGSHLGHVFDDGPEPTGQRFCINSLALDLKPTEEQESK